MDNQDGISLLELTAVIIILGIIAAAVVPSFMSGDRQSVTTATNAVVQALRFARNEAIRTGNPHGVRFTDQQRVRVFRLDVTGTPTEQYTVYDPISKQLYDEDVTMSSAVVVVASFKFEIVGLAQTAIAFNARGEPIAADDLDPLYVGGVDVTCNSIGDAITLTPLTGRVTVQ